MKQLHRTAFTVSTVLIAAALLAGCSSPAPSDGGGDDPTSGPIKSTLAFAYSNAVQQAEKVPLHLALDNLTKDGIKSSELFNQTPADAIQQVAVGEADFGTAAASAVFAAIKQGVPIVAVMTAYRPDYVLVAPSSVTDAGGLDGLRVGIQSKISSTTLYTNLALSDFPDAKPKILVVAGSANRVQAMVAGQMDASVLQLGDWLALDKSHPGQFHVIYEVAKENPDLIDSVIFTAASTVKDDPAYVKAFLAAVQDGYGSINDDPDALAAALASVVPGMTADIAKVLAPALIAGGTWPADGGFSKAAIKSSLEAMADAELLTTETLPTVDECCTADYIKQGK